MKAAPAFLLTMVALLGCPSATEDLGAEGTADSTGGPATGSPTGDTSSGQSDDSTAEEAGSGSGGGSQADVGPDGGMLVSEDGAAVLYVPAGALRETVTLAIEVSADASIPSAASSVYELSPSGLEFEVPATLMIESVGTGVPASGHVLVSRSADDDPWATLGPPIVDDAGRTGADVFHFSKFGLADRRCAMLGDDPMCTDVGTSCVELVDTKYCALACEADIDCAEPMACIDGACADKICESSADCRAGAECINISASGGTLNRCRRVHPCLEGQLQQNGYCIWPSCSSACSGPQCTPYCSEPMACNFGLPAAADEPTSWWLSGTCLPPPIDVIIELGEWGHEEWSGEVEAVQGFLDDLAQISGDFRLITLACGADDICVPAPWGSGECPNDANPPKYANLESDSDIDGDPRYCGFDLMGTALLRYEEPIQALRPNSLKVIVAPASQFRFLVGMTGQWEAYDGASLQAAFDEAAPGYFERWQLNLIALEDQCADLGTPPGDPAINKQEFFEDLVAEAGGVVGAYCPQRGCDPGGPGIDTHCVGASNEPFTAVFDAVLGMLQGDCPRSDKCWYGPSWIADQ